MDKRPQPRYQIFVSSTFVDLETERNAALKAILDLGQFPAGMESFPSVSSPPWDYIKTRIEESDYYVLIIGGRYGSTDETGLSFTEKEYQYAVSLGRYILVFVHGDPDSIAQKLVDKEAAKRKRLAKFRKIVSAKHQLKKWTNITELQSAVMAGLNYAFTYHQQEGWVKASGFNNSELMAKLLAAQERIATLEREKSILAEQISADHLPSTIARGDDPVDVEVLHFGREKTNHKFTLTWDDLFYAIAEELMYPNDGAIIDREVSGFIYANLKQSPAYLSGEIGPGKHSDDSPRDYVSGFKPDTDVILTQFMALGLVEMHYHQEPTHTMPDAIFGGMKQVGGQLWVKYVLSPKGLKKYVTHQAVQKKAG